MRLQFRSIELPGADRRVEFGPGLNLIVGEIATGKTSLIELARGLLGAFWESLPPEVEAASAGVQGEVLLRDERYEVFRPFGSGSLVEAAEIGGDEAVRLPVARPATPGGATYGDWLLTKLDLPHLVVPRAPTQPESDPTAVSISDYLRYTHIPQDQMGLEVFGHRNPFRNIKRKYVFEITYGFYGYETAILQEELRDVSSKIRGLELDSNALDRVLSGTALASRAELLAQLVDVEERQVVLSQRTRSQAVDSARNDPTLVEDRQRIFRMASEVAELLSSIAELDQASARLRELEDQLHHQIERTSRAIVAGTYIYDIEFRVCPRCGSAVGPTRTDDEHCLLCLQEPQLDFDRTTLLKEQERLEAQVSETAELIGYQRRQSDELRSRVADLETIRAELSASINARTHSWVSSEAEDLRAVAAEAASLEATADKLREFLDVHQRFDAGREELTILQDRRVDLQTRLEAERGQVAEAEERTRIMGEYFASILETFRAPQLGEATIDRGTYLPRISGRTFDSLSSPGWRTLVGVAYALAYHETALDLNLEVPAQLIVDSPATHLGSEGLDPERVAAMYRYFAEMCDRRGDAFQLIVVDNSVPSGAERFVRVRLSDADRLIPTAVLDDQGA